MSEVKKMTYTVDNAVIMAAGTSSRFAPISYERPKALISVRGERLIERQIRQLQEVGIPEIIVVVGYKKEQFYYLEEKFKVKIVENNDYLKRNNNSSIYAVRKYLNNTYICSADNYFEVNPFECEVTDSYYAAVYSEGPTEEWCMQEDDNGFIKSVEIGGCDSWYMMGHVFWNQDFSHKFVKILEEEYDRPETKGLLWESIFRNHLSELDMRIRKYESNQIFEFDTLEELRKFDPVYTDNSQSEIMENIAHQLSCHQKDMTSITALLDDYNTAIGFTFMMKGQQYKYLYQERALGRI